MMRLLDHYNEVRMEKLREIEDVLSQQMHDTIPPFQQYAGLPYTLTRALRIGRLTVRWTLSPMRLYRAIWIVYTIINVGVVCTRAFHNFQAKP